MTVGALGFSAQAQNNELVFRANEFALDVFGSVSVGQDVIDHISSDRVEDNGRLGLGLGGNYFATRHLGIGVDAYSENAAHSFVDNTSANVIIRIPIESVRLAPYIYGGGGRQFDPSTRWFGQIGGGLEFRITPEFGIFTDARYVIPDEANEIGLARVGARFKF